MEEKSNPAGTEHWQRCWVEYVANEQSALDGAEDQVRKVLDLAYEIGYAYEGVVVSQKTVNLCEGASASLQASPDVLGTSLEAKQAAMQLKDLASKIRPGDILLSEASRASVKAAVIQWDHATDPKKAKEVESIQLSGVYTYQLSVVDKKAEVKAWDTDKIMVYASGTDCYMNIEGNAERCRKGEMVLLDSKPYLALAAAKIHVAFHRQITGKVYLVPDRLINLSILYK